MSELTKTEQETVAECTMLMEKYIEYYSTANSDAIGSLYAAPYAAAVGDDYMNMEGISANSLGFPSYAFRESVQHLQYVLVRKDRIWLENEICDATR